MRGCHPCLLMWKVEVEGAGEAKDVSV